VEARHNRPNCILRTTAGKVRPGGGPVSEYEKAAVSDRGCSVDSATVPGSVQPTHCCMSRSGEDGGRCAVGALGPLALLLTPALFCHVERSQDISNHYQKRIARDSSTALGMTGLEGCSLCAQRSCTPLQSIITKKQRKRATCPLGAQATGPCSLRTPAMLRRS